MRRIVIAVACFGLLLGTRESFAQSAPASDLPNPYLLQYLAGGSTLDRYLQAVRTQVVRLDADGNGMLDAADIEAHNAVNAAQFRTMFANRIMMADLNDDKVVTEDELRRKFLYDHRQTSAALPRAANINSNAEQDISKYMAADLNHDGRITWDEAVELAKKQPDYARTTTFGLGASLSKLLALAPPGKNAITMAEIEEAATALFRQVDTDKNGTISLDELDVARRRQNQASAASAMMPRVICDVPKASEAAKVVLLGAYQTESLSSVTLGSQDEVVGLGNVIVEPGKDPLYIAVATYEPTIWRFYGATERIERVVVMSSGGRADKATGRRVPLAGVVGLPAERVSFPQAVGCLGYFTATPTTQSAVASGAIKAAAGRAPDVLAGKYAVTAFNVPSGKTESLGQVRAGSLQIVQGGATYLLENGKVSVVQPDKNMDQTLYRFRPGGVVTVDAKNVVASAKADAYEVLPQEAGLSQLLKSGVLTRNGQGEYLINKKMRFPAGLTGAHSAKFLLLRGVPKPEGQPGHSRVVSEETGEFLKFEPAR